MSATYRVTFQITPPVDATEEQVEEWIKFHIGATGSMKGDNPLADHDLDGRHVFVQGTP